MTFFFSALPVVTCRLKKIHVDALLGVREFESLSKCSWKSLIVVYVLSLLQSYPARFSYIGLPVVVFFPFVNGYTP